MEVPMQPIRILVSTAALAALVVTSSSTALRAEQATDPTIASVKTTYDVVKGYITKAAAQIPADKYSYQPTKDVRTIAALFGHIANASTLICNTSSGMGGAPTSDAEKLTAKADVVKALAAGFAACDHAFQMISAKNANETVTLFGMTHSRIGGMAFNTAHNFEHYGNIVTYMRMNGLVPPSSGGGGEN
jgi:uncharacterized damage-inducible protein DinB